MNNTKNRKDNVELPEFGKYAVAMLFFDNDTWMKAREIFEKFLNEYELEVMSYLKLKIKFFINLIV